MALCRALLGYFPDFHYRPVAIHDNAPPQPDLVNVGVMWVRCPNSHCRKWNAFRIAPPNEEEDDG